MRQLLWLRTDLRVHDNTALAAAAAQGPVLAIFLLSPGQWQAHGDAPCKLDFWLRNLRELSSTLKQLNIPLLIRHAEHWQDAPQVLAEVCRELSISALHVNAEYGIHESQRDAQVSNLLAQQGVGFHSHLDQLFFAPGSILNKAGKYFQVYSQFRNRCYQQWHLGTPALLASPRPQMELGIASDPLPEQVPGFAKPRAELRQHWPAGETAAHARLDAFAEQRLQDYQAQRDFPALDGTSQISAYLAAGVLSPRQCLHSALSLNQGAFESGQPGIVCWINELLWREFYKHILVGFPRVSRHRAFRLETEALPWRQAPAELEAWQQGRTGFPIIDAAMRQLLATGWMHNRLRMLTAMFLSKNLLIDWREGERWFMAQLIDGDLAANNGGWQWCASTGTDAVPYFRLFNPLTQSQKFDPQGHFIRRWLPELADLNNSDIHQPGLFASNYPPPILDLAASRQRVLQAFKELPRAAMS